MDIANKIDVILKKRGWTRYRLSKESNLPESTLTNIFHRNTTPSINTLSAICSTLGITLSEFFAEGKVIELTPELEQLINDWQCLSSEKRDCLITMIKLLK